MELNVLASIVLILCLQSRQIIVSSQNEGEVLKKIDQLPYPPNCGYHQQDYRRIIGGVISKENAWPWIAALGEYENDDYVAYYCAGTLISKRHILTAAHCFSVSRVKSFATLGVTNLNSSDHMVNENVKKIIVHHNFDIVTYENDIAVLELERDVKFTDAIHPICLSFISEKLNNGDFVGEFAFIAGWGVTTLGNVTQGSDDLREAKLQVISNEQCKKDMTMFQAAISSSTICAANPGKSPCMGDSGGPLMYVHDSVKYLIGIVSNGYKCGDENNPSVFTRVSAYRNFILVNTHLAEKSAAVS